eukprot:TRINITY_DN2785_c0_g1_i1.p2 TRINITY_DN2785_c0_g1~~TRINITY_DN2785_c0_g1_i1.p2  ORF type:complete len:170 (+),score=61.44 TRINITY_DN2785_c0_g1_i1:72-581(+)
MEDAGMPVTMDLGGMSPPAAGSPVSFDGGMAPVQAADPFQGMPTQPSGGNIPQTNALREWEEKHEAELEKIARDETAQKEERRKKAATELKEWTDEKSSANSKRLTTNRADEKATEAARAEALKPGANPWERVVDLIDTSAKTADEARDTTRMRNLLIQLKSNPVVSAA